ncbi:MAG TPA: enoyl-CoA hydratase-related protein [Amycolatopsis sp.]|nr:enoyl-CoA hydratase-related protein [Amycolatopsis sp.]
METLEFDRIGGVGVVRLANPPVNAVSRTMMRELRETFLDLAERRDIGSVVLSAAGDRAFCGGIDLKERSREVEAGSAARSSSIAATLDSGRQWRDAQASIRHCPVPVVAAIDGPAIGAGFGLAASCDIMIASARARLGLTEINVGMLGGSSKALRMVGPYKARMMFFSGELVPAEELYRLGAIEKVVPAGEAEKAAIELAETFARKSPIALRLAKESLVRIEALDFDPEVAYRTEQDYTNRLKDYADSREAQRAFFEKREPHWTWS